MDKDDLWICCVLWKDVVSIYTDVKKPIKKFVKFG